MSWRRSSTPSASAATSTSVGKPRVGSSRATCCITACTALPLAVPNRRRAGWAGRWAPAPCGCPGPWPRGRRCRAGGGRPPHRTVRRARLSRRRSRRRRANSEPCTKLTSEVGPAASPSALARPLGVQIRRTWPSGAIQLVGLVDAVRQRRRRSAAHDSAGGQPATAVGAHGERDGIGRCDSVDQPAGGAAAVLVVHRHDEMVLGPRERDIQQPGFFGPSASGVRPRSCRASAGAGHLAETDQWPAALPVQPGRRVRWRRHRRDRQRS